MRTRRIARAVLADLACVLVFAAIGRASHGETLAPVGILTTVWPFAAGLTVGWVLAQAPPLRPASPAGLVAGVIVWASTVAVGMGLRVGTGAGVQLSFVIVAAVVLGLFLLGWRGVVALVDRARRTTRADVRV